MGITGSFSEQGVFHYFLTLIYPPIRKKMGLRCRRWRAPFPRLRELLEARARKLRGRFCLRSAVIEAPNFCRAEDAVIDAGVVDPAFELAAAARNIKPDLRSPALSTVAFRPSFPVVRVPRTPST